MDLLKAIVPSRLKELYKLKQLKKRYPYSTVQSAKIGENVCIGKGTVITNDVLVQNGVVIGNYTYINTRSFVFSGKIGNFCSISYNVIIGPASHPLDYLSTSPFTYCENNVYNNPLIWKDEYTSPPIIGNDVLIGVNAVILQGVTIGDGAVVAAGAIVNRDVPPYTIVGGIPAKTIKRRFSQKVIDRLLELKWWQFAPEDITQYREILNNFERWKDLE